jgi:energy-coupling factor transporter ATP-binding protein EcfA2
MYTFKLTQITLNDGSKFEPGKLTVIVGPNNVGKSRALKDIATLVTNAQTPLVVVKDVEWPMPQSLQELFDSHDVEPRQDPQGAWVRFGLNYLMSGGQNMGIGGEWRRGMEKSIQNRAMRKEFASYFGSWLLTFLTTEHRLALVQSSESPKHERDRSSLLQVVYVEGKSLEREINSLVKEAFGQEIILDYTLLQRLFFRVGDDFSRIPVDPRDARPILQQYEILDDQGDGIRSFIGILVALLSIKRSLVLIDEPEAFLHPPQAFRIGEFLAHQSSDARQIIIATHSADVLRGIVTITQDVSIVRFDRIGNKSSFRFLHPGRVKELVTDPLLSSARVLDGLFYSGAIVVEAESDGRFYHAASKKRRPDADLHFVNADNKQTVPRIAQMYRDMGVRCAGVVDFDVLNDRSEFQKQLEALSLDVDELNEAGTIREEIAKAANESSPEEKLAKINAELTGLLDEMAKIRSQTFASNDEASLTRVKFLRKVESSCRGLADATRIWKQLKREGRAALPEQLQGQFDRLWQICASKGLFINPCGELESMLAEYGIPYATDKRAWIVKALQLLPNLEVSDQKQPWKFIKDIHEHISKGLR